MKFLLQNWSSKDLKLDSKAVSSGLSIRRAAEEYQIPKSTIQDHVSEMAVRGANNRQQKYLTKEEEELVEILLGSAKIWYPWTRRDTVSLVQTLFIEKGRNIIVIGGW